MFKKLLAWMFPFFSLFFWHDFENLTRISAYSSGEYDTGKIWIDGKHIYGRTYSANNVSINGDVVIDSTFTGDMIDTLVSMNGGGFSSGSKTYATLGMVNYANDRSYGFCATINTSQSSMAGVVITLRGWQPVTKYSLVIEYTKA